MYMCNPNPGWGLENSDRVRRLRQSQQKLVYFNSKDFKEEQKVMREKIEEEYKDTHHWLDGDNQANSPYEADWSDIDD